MPANDIPQSVFAPFMDPCDIHLPLDVTGELLRCSTANGHIDYYYLLAIYRAGVAAGRAALQSPPPREADAALWPLVERLHQTVKAYEDGTKDPVSLDLESRDAERAVLAYRPPSAPAPAVTPTAKPHVESCERCQMKLPEHLGTYAIGVRGGTAWRCAACQPIEGPSGRLLREEVVNRRKRHLAALASPPPPETQP